MPPPTPASKLPPDLRSGLLPAQPVRVDVPAPAPSTARITAVIPCFNRPDDARLLLSDLARVRDPRIDLHVLLVDNASTTPLSALPTPSDLSLEHLRLDTNTGGSGGFNAGLAHALNSPGGTGPGGTGLQTRAPDFLWLLDSDARVDPDALTHLLLALEAHPHAAAAGSSLADPLTGEVFELGGHVDRRSGLFVQPTPTPEALAADAIGVEYVAACSMLVRAGAAARAGLMPDVFVNGDDVGWCLRLARFARGADPLASPGSILAVPRSRARHPHHNKMHTWGRYYIARNAFGPIDALRLGKRTRFRRAMREVLRAAIQQCMNRPDLAALHLGGLRDARRGLTSGPAPQGTITFDPFEPLACLADRLTGALPVPGASARLTIEPGLVLPEPIAATLRSQLDAAGVSAPIPRPAAAPASLAGELTAALARFLLGPLAPRRDIAIVTTRGRPRSWFRGALQIQLLPDARGGFVLRRTPRLRALLSVASTLARGAVESLRLALGPPVARPATPLLSLPAAPRTKASTATRTSLCVIVLSHNRWPMLRRTLARLSSSPAFAGAELVVVDNASSDSTPSLLARHFPHIRRIPLPANIGVAAFNRAAERTAAELLLILDDDATPDDAAITGAIDLLDRRPDLGAVAFHPLHPSDGRSEWPFACSVDPAVGTDRWPVMGCANLIRRDLWLRAGGYQEPFFLYRNDADLALTLLDLGAGVHFRPSWIAWHDSPGAARKSPRWHHLATRNWVWMAKRHGGKGMSARAGTIAGMLLGWAWAHRLATLSPSRHVATLRGALEGLLRAAPPGPPSSGGAFGSLLSLHLRGRESHVRKAP